MTALVSRLRGAIQSEVGFALTHAAARQARDARQELCDLMQDVYVELLARNGRVLRSWDPKRGRSLDSFVRLVARRHVAGVIRSKRRNPFSEPPLPAQTVDRQHSPVPGLEPHADARDRLDQLFARLEQRLDERGLMLFQMLYVEEQTVEEACEATGMTRDAVYAWRSRLKRILATLTEPSSDGRLVRDGHLADNG